MHWQSTQPWCSGRQHNNPFALCRAAAAAAADACVQISTTLKFEGIVVVAHLQHAGQQQQQQQQQMLQTSPTLTA
eukprot:1148392-Pelagomonas_calceolata.AAC.8